MPKVRVGKTINTDSSRRIRTLSPYEGLVSRAAAVATSPTEGSVPPWDNPVAGPSGTGRNNVPAPQRRSNERVIFTGELLMRMVQEEEDDNEGILSSDLDSDVREEDLWEDLEDVEPFQSPVVEAEAPAKEAGNIQPLGQVAALPTSGVQVGTRQWTEHRPETTDIPFTPNPELIDRTTDLQTPREYFDLLFTSDLVQKCWKRPTFLPRF